MRGTIPAPASGMLRMVLLMLLVATGEASAQRDLVRTRPTRNGGQVTQFYDVVQGRRTKVETVVVTARGRVVIDKRTGGGWMERTVATLTPSADGGVHVHLAAKPMRFSRLDPASRATPHDADYDPRTGQTTLVSVSSSPSKTYQLSLAAGLSGMDLARAVNSGRHRILSGDFEKVGGDQKTWHVTLSPSAGP
jgi:hypothetical protein